MRKTLALSLFAVLAVAASRAPAPCAFADDAKTYTLPPSETWKAGDVASTHGVDHQVQKQTVKGADGTVLQAQVTDEAVESSVVLKALEVDAQGAYSKALLYVAKWSRKAGEGDDKKEDTSLTGKHVEITGAPGARTVKVLGADAKVSDEAVKWLDKQYAKHTESDSDAAFNPKKPVAVGESWTPEMTALESMFSGGGHMKFVSEKTKATITLVSVENDAATLALDFALQAAAMETPQGKMDWAEGGGFTMKATGTKPLKAGDHKSSGKMTGGLKGTMNAPGGVQVDLDITFENETETQEGGDMPPAPGAK